MQIKLLRQVVWLLYYDTNIDFYMIELSLMITVGIYINPFTDLASSVFLGRSSPSRF